MHDPIKYIPDFFVIGAMKAGTSTLFRDFFVNPEIDRTKGKEVNFMLQDLSFEEQNQKYKNQFRNNGSLKCDVSPKYSQWHKHPGVPERIFRANPDARIIYITRDPIDRIISHLHHNLLRHRFSERDINVEVMRNDDYIMCSKYQFQIDKYQEYFPTDRILVLMLEELKSDPETFCKRLNSFLGLNSLAFTGKMFNVSENRYKIVGHDAVHRVIKNKSLIRLYHRLWQVINIKVARPDLSAEVRSALMEKLNEDTNRFAGTFGLNLKLWKNFR